MLLTLATVLLLFDLLTTVVAVRRAGTDMESNPLQRRIMQRLGLGGFAILYVAVAGGVLWLCRGHDALLAGLAGVLTLVAANNAYALIQLFKRTKS